MFYEGLFDPPEEALPRDLQRLKNLIPSYYGICDIEDRAGETCILSTWCVGERKRDGGRRREWGNVVASSPFPTQLKPL